MQALAHGIDFARLVTCYGDNSFDAVYVATYLMRADILCWLHHYADMYHQATHDQRTDIIFFAIDSESMDCLRALQKPVNKGGFGWDLNVKSSDGHTPLSIARRSGNDDVLIELLKPIELGGFGLPLDEAMLSYMWRANPDVIQPDSRARYQREQRGLQRSLSFMLKADDLNQKVDRYEPVKNLGKGTYGDARLFACTSKPEKYLCVKKPSPAVRAINNSFELFLSANNMNKELLMMKTAYPDDRYQIQYFFDEASQKFDYRFMMPFIEGDDYQVTILSMTNIDELPHWILAITLELQRIHETGTIHLDIKPENILCKKIFNKKTRDFTYQVTFIDFGFANFINRDVPIFNQTADWMAPEVFDRSNGIALAQTSMDVYSLAYLTQQAVTHCSITFIPEYERWKERFVCISEFIENGMKVNPQERPSLGSFIEGLRKVMKGDLVETNRPVMGLK